MGAYTSIRAKRGDKCFLETLVSNICALRLYRFSRKLSAAGCQPRAQAFVRGLIESDKVLLWNVRTNTRSNVHAEVRADARIGICINAGIDWVWSACAGFSQNFVLFTRNGYVKCRFKEYGSALLQKCLQKNACVPRFAWVFLQDVIPRALRKRACLNDREWQGRKVINRGERRFHIVFFSRRPDFPFSAFWFSAFSKPSIFISARIYAKTPLNRSKTSCPSAISSNSRASSNDYPVISSGRQAFWVTVKHFGWLSRVVSVTKQFRVIVKHFERQSSILSVSKRFRVIAEDMQRCLCLARTICSRSVQKGPCRQFFILYLSRLCLCALKIRVRNAPRRFFLSFLQVLADGFLFCIWVTFACARLKSVSETRAVGFFLSFFAEKGSATEKSSTAGKFDRVGSNYKIIL